MKKAVLIAIILGMLALGALPLLAAPGDQPAAGSGHVMQAQVDLAWFMAGLRDLLKTKDSKLKLIPAQAKKILPEVEALIKERLIILELNQQRTGQQQNRTTGTGGGAPSEADRRAASERAQQNNKKIQTAIDKMEKALTPQQVNSIIKMKFDPVHYGLGSFGDFRNMTDAERQKMQKARQEGMQRLVKLNQETVDLLRKLAK